MTADELVPLGELTGSDFARTATRCAGLSLAVWRSGFTNDPILLDAMDARVNHFVSLVIYTFGTEPGVEMDGEEAIALLEPVVASYEALMDAAGPSGNLFSDPVVSSDLDYCEMLYVPGH